jgi:hypothetical protein
MPIRLQTSHRLVSLPSLINANYPIADDDDIDWNTDPFEMRPDRVNLETPVEIIAMIKVSGSPWLQEQLRSRCRPNGYQNRSNEVGGAVQPPLPLTPFR